MKNFLLIYLLFTLFSFKIFANEKQIEVGIDEQLGKTIPMQEYFVDENGDRVLLKDLFTKPTVFAFVYYNCPGICSPLLMELTNVINKTDLVIGVDFNIVVISMDELETPSDALTKKQTFFQAFDRTVPPESWKFLTGDSATIKKIADAAGFHFKRQGKDFLHNGAFIFIDNQGKICRYLFPSYTDRRGFGILPFDFKMAVLETSEGKVSPTMAKVLQLCFRYDPEGKTYVLSFTRIFGAGILILIGIFVFVFLRVKRKKDFIKTR
jgi:protein SCO1/2